MSRQIVWYNPDELTAFAVILSSARSERQTCSCVGDIGRMTELDTAIGIVERVIDNRHKWC